MVTRGFVGRRPNNATRGRLPPGQHLVEDFPVLTAGATPRVSTDTWSFSLRHGIRPVQSWTWQAFQKLPMTKMTTDIHCVTTWSKLDTRWEGVLVEDLLEAAGFTAPPAFVLAHSHDGYSTNMPTVDLLRGKAMIALKYDGEPLSRDHGGPARLLVPHLYLWKSAKWVKSLQFIDKDTAGFWELRGYHIHGDPWKEQRYTDD
jgi:DMSO/TMAO reductase YedYZ molybdopterin-dependent catalytic subunit